MRSLALVFYYTRQNRYSINSLLGSLQTKENLLENIDTFLTFNEDHLIQELQIVAAKYKKVIICFSFASVQLTQYISIIKKIKQLNLKNLIIISGGPHPTGNPISTLKTGFDLCFIGESEEIFLSFLEKQISDSSWKDLESVAFIENEKFIVNKRTKRYVDLDKFPPISTYFNRYGPIEITRGCPYNCYFCQTSQIFGTKLRHRSIETILKLVEDMAKRNLFDTRFITPSLFLYGTENPKNLNLQKIEELLKSVSKIIKPKGKLFIGTFPSEIRPEHINKDTVYILKKYADNDNVIIGAQSGSDRILEISHRGHTSADVYNAIELLTKAGFKVNIDMIFGLPYEEEKDIKITKKFIEKITAKYNSVKIHAHIFMPLVGTKFQRYKVENLEFYLKYLREFKNKNLIYGNWEKQADYVKNSHSNIFCI